MNSLEAVKSIIEERGWIQGAYFGACGGVCLSGACILAVGGDLLSYDTSNPNSPRISEYRALYDQLFRRIKTLPVEAYGVVDYNDEVASSQSEIMNLLSMEDV